jgi:DNA-binding response OmpR family regulator
MELGGIEFMNKPFNPRQLVAVLESLVTDPLPPAPSTAMVAAHPVASAPAGDGPARR